MIASIFIVAYFTICSIGLIYGLFHRENYKPEVGFFIVIMLYVASESVYFILFNLSVETFFDVNLALILWSVSIFARVISNGTWSAIHSMELNKSSRVRFLPVIIYILLGGIILSLLFNPVSFLVTQTEFEYYYFFSNLPLLISIVSFNGFIVVISWITQIKGYKDINDRKLGKLYFLFVFLLCLKILWYTLYILTLNSLFKILHQTFYIIFIGFVVFLVVKKPNVLVVFTNKIYDFIIFHKSGILLYSFNFEKQSEVDESFLKGSILIGINHILANLSNVENQITLIKMSDRAIVFNYNNQLGYAVLLIAKHKNKILESAVDNFTNKFAEINKDSLKKLGGLIDVSIFKNAHDLIEEYFSHYLTGK
jgi:hypothetical protein